MVPEMRHRTLVLLLLSALGTIIGGAFSALTQLFPEATSTVVNQTLTQYGISDVTLVYQVITLVFIVSLAIVAIIVMLVISDRRKFDAKILDKNRFRLGETVRFKAYYKGKLTRGFFTCKVAMPDGRRQFWPAPDTFQHSKEGDVGVLSGKELHAAEWGFHIPRDFPAGEYLAQIGVWDAKDPLSGNSPVREKSTSFMVLSLESLGTFGTSTFAASGVTWVDTETLSATEGQSRLVITEADAESNNVKKLLVRFPHGEVREHEVRFYYVKVRVAGEKSVDDAIAYCGANQMRFVPSTQKSTFGVDFEGSETLAEFDREGIESYVVALLRDHRKVRDEIKYIHPGPKGASFVLFFTLKGLHDCVYVPAHTRVPHNIYGGTYGTRIIGHRKGIIRLRLDVYGRDVEGCSAEYEVDFHDWRKFTVKRLDVS